MKAVLDTHVWLWYVLGDERLTDGQRRCIEDESVELWVSPISIWEAQLLKERRRIPIAEPPARWIDKAVVLERGDPADRFIAATAGVDHH